MGVWKSRQGERGSDVWGFEVVRRGYECGEVDERIRGLVEERDRALARIAVLERRIEELYLGGAEVSRCAGGVAAAGGFREGAGDSGSGDGGVVGVGVESGARPVIAFRIARRGYDREQVDERIQRLVTECEGAAARIDVLVRRVGELEGGAPGE